MRTLYRFCKVTEQWVERPVEVAPSATHAVIQDSMPPTWHPLTGELMDSKSRFREVTRAHGYTEIGNESFQGRKQEDKSGQALEHAFRRALGNV